MSKVSFEMNFEDGNLSFCLSEESGMGKEIRRKRVRFVVVFFYLKFVQKRHKSLESLIKSVSRNANQEHCVVFQQI